MTSPGGAGIRSSWQGAPGEVTFRPGGIRSHPTFTTSSRRLAAAADTATCVKPSELKIRIRIKRMALSAFLGVPNPPGRDQAL